MTILLIILAVVAMITIATALVLRHPAFGRKVSKERKARIDASSNYRDGMFQNEEPTPQFTGNTNSLKAMWMMLTRRDSNRVPVEPLPVVKTDLMNLPIEHDWFVWFGHSSYLFQLGGKRFLVDPLLKMEYPASLILKPFKGTDIYSPDDMPEIDYLIITHEHWDHLDYATLRDLRQKIAHVICPLGVGEYLEYWGYDKSIMSELDWYEKKDEITCLPSRHFSNRLLRGRNQTLWAAFMVEVGDRKVYIGGDGGYDHRFKRVSEQFGKIDLAIMENGQYNPNWAYIHMLPQDLERAILDLQAEHVFTVHHDKFALSMHAWFEPDSVAHSIAERHPISILDKPIGSVVEF